MQRLFSMFPDGAPGAALLLLRLALSMGIVLDDAWSAIARGLLAALLAIGALTPFAAVVSAGAIALSCILEGEAAGQRGLLTLQSLSLALLGPGAWSLDARLFGRRRLVFPRNDRDPTDAG